MATMGGRTQGAAITGAAGFLGAHLVRGFHARGAHVLPLVREMDDNAPPRSRVVADVLDRPAILTGIDVVVHAAAVRHRYGVDPAAYRASNVDLVEGVMRACAASGVRRFVFISSVGIYGFPSTLPIREASACAPRTLYSATKVEAEALARRLAASLGLELSIARPTIFYGRGDRNGMLDKMAAMIRAGTYRVVGSGNNILHHAHVDDIVEGVWLAATRPEAAGEDFILAGPETTTLAELSALVAQGVGRDLSSRRVPLPAARGIAALIDAAARRGIAFAKREPPINGEKLDVMTLSVAFDIAKARRCLGFAPRIGYEEGIMRTLKSDPESPAPARGSA